MVTIIIDKEIEKEKRNKRVEENVRYLMNKIERAISELFPEGEKKREGEEQMIGKIICIKLHKTSPLF